MHINFINNNNNFYDLSYLLSQLKAELDIKQHNLAQSECLLTFSIDPIAEDFYLELLKDNNLHHKYNFQYDYRQFVNEILLLEYFRISKCRIKNHNNHNLLKPIKLKSNNFHQDKEVIHSRLIIPHYYIIFLPFKYLYGLKESVTFLQKQKLKLIIGNLLKSHSFQYDREHYVLIYTATFSFQGHFISHLVKNFVQVLDTRIVRIGIEGIGGDNRLIYQNDMISKAQYEYQLYGSRMIIVPYFVDRKEHMQDVLKKVGMLNNTIISSFMKNDRDIKYYMRASGQKGSDLRLQLYHAFSNISNAVIKLANLNKHNATLPMQLYTHYLELQNALFCICPKGLTASASRYQKALEAGCIPVIISDNITLPFEEEDKEIVRLLRYDTDILHWDNAVVRYPEAKISELPQYLESFSSDKIQSLQANGKILTQQLRYLGSTLQQQQLSSPQTNKNNNVFDLLEKELHRFSSYETNFGLFFNKDLLIEGIKTYRTVVVTIYDPFDDKESNNNNNNDKSMNSNLLTNNFSQWLESLRTVVGYEGPIIILSNNISSIDISHTRYQKYTFLLSTVDDNLTRIIPNHPPYTSKFHHNFIGKQLQLVWKSYILTNLAAYVSDDDDKDANTPPVVVIVVDSNDVIFRKNPFHSLSLLRSNCYQRSIIVSQHCDKCNNTMMNDNYHRFNQLQVMKLIVNKPLINRSIVIGNSIAALAKFYMKASILASLSYTETLQYINKQQQGGSSSTSYHSLSGKEVVYNSDNNNDDHHIIAATIYELQKLEPNEICIITHKDKLFNELFKL